MNRLVIGMTAHVDSGKTTLSEAMLYTAGELRRLGRVDHGNTFLDTDPIERSRGITVFSKQAVLETARFQITLLDTPGHVDFSAETERALRVMDYAVLVISGTDGVQSHTETLWRLLKRYNIPTFIFVNKMDISFLKESSHINELKRKLGYIKQANIAVRHFPLSANELRKRLKLRDGGDTYLFATTFQPSSTSRQERILMITEKA